MRSSILVSCLAAFAFSGAAFGACLQDDYSIAAEYARSVAVVQARVVSEREVPDPEAPPGFVGGTIYKVRVEESFRGVLQGTVEVFSENSSGRFPMEKERSYLLFLYQAAGWLSADPCGNSGLVAQKRSVLGTVRALSKPAHSDQKPGGSTEPTPGSVTAVRSEVFTGENLNVPFTVHGRLRNYMGYAQMRIWIVGSTRMLGVEGETPETAKIAALFPKGGWFDYTVYGDFTVEPLAPDIKGHKRPVRILKIRNVVVERDADDAITFMQSEL